MGLFRLLLAMLVAVSHAGISFHDYNPGVVAVISFFILSGYVMSMLIEKYYKKPPDISTFYLDRAARIFPQFLFYMLLASACIYFLEIDSSFTKNLNFANWLLNFLVLPLGFYMYWAGGEALVIPQAWSLGLEMTFYLVIPWVTVYCTSRQIYQLAFVSFLVFLTAYFGKLNTDIFGYRLLFGTFFIFLIGWSFLRNDSHQKKFRVTVFLSAGALLLTAYKDHFLYQLPYNKEVLVGLMIGILVVGLIKNLGFSRLDEFFGNLSYGVFLNHFIIIWMMKKIFVIKTFDAFNIVILLISSCALAFFSFLYIERPALKWRRAIRSGVIHRTCKTL